MQYLILQHTVTRIGSILLWCQGTVLMIMPVQSGHYSGDYVVKNDWFDINGIFLDITGQGETGRFG